MTPQKLPLGIVDFEELRTPDEDGRTYVYVDKTEHIAALAKGSVYNFLTRPRRYGKSLLHSTLYHLFSGHKHLFEGLWVAQEGHWNWGVTYPVLRIDFNVIEKQEAQDPNSTTLSQALARYMDTKAQAEDITLSAPTAGGKLSELIAALAQKTGRKVVVLIDEYDKPIVNHLETAKRHQAEENREALRNFYSVLKGNETAIHFMLITGVSKFGRLSIFSDLSHLVDLTMLREFSTMLGYTQEEIKTCFAPWLEDWCRAEGFTAEELWAHMTAWYNGYSWNGLDFLYTPWSVLNALKSQEFQGFWSASGTPKMLVDLLKDKQIMLPELTGQWVRADIQNQTSLESVDATALCWQTGYLTVKAVKGRADRRRYLLDLPNREVRESFLLYYLKEYNAFDAAKGSQLADGLYDTLLDGDMAGFLDAINTLLAKIPYHLYPKAPQESYFHTIVFLAALLSGHPIAAEVAVAGGRIDVVLEAPDAFYVCEFKLSDAHTALQQIAARDYTRAYLHQGKKVVALGVAFNAQERTIGSWAQQTLHTP